jgi:hypothetical protein
LIYTSASKPEGKGNFGDVHVNVRFDIKMDVNETGYKDLDCVQLAHVSMLNWGVVNAVLNTQISRREGNFLNC